MTPHATDKAAREIAHGRMLAERDTEEVWGWGSPAGERRFARRVAAIVERAAVGPRTKVLELGCGTGMFTTAFANTGAAITAIDISPELLERARARVRTQPNVRLVAGRFEDAELDGPFDAVIGSSVLHHLEVVPSLRRIHELLKPGGRIAFAEPNYLNPQVFLERTFRFLPPFRSYVSPDETAFVRFFLQRRLTSEGFRQVAITPFDWLHPSTPPRFIPLVQRTGRALEFLPVLREGAGSLLIGARRP